MQPKIPFKEHSKIYKPSQIKEVLDISVNKRAIIGNSKGAYYYNIPCAFDIETTSFYRDIYGAQYDYKEYQEELEKDDSFKPEKICVMYVWQLGINGNVIIGRTWDEFLEVCDCISSQLELSDDLRIIIYVHNLSYEFQFLKHLFEWKKVFSLDTRKPIYAITAGNIEFRCSYLLSGYSLQKLSSQLDKYHVEKMVGDLDYALLRHSETPLSENEIRYCENDVRVVMAYIQEKIEQDKGIQNIPLTKTGYVRNYCRKHCLYKYNVGREKNFDYIDLMAELKINDLEEFDELQRAFAGGFTHANAYFVGDIIDDVASYDFTSSYPYVMISEMFPMSKGTKVEITSKEQFDNYIKTYCCVFDVVFEDIIASVSFENPLSVSKCFIKENIVENNGRVVCAKKVMTTITNVDWITFTQFYKWEHCSVGNFYIYKKGYLPSEFVKSILTLYQKKTELKGVKGKEVEYLNSKEMLNSCYGMSVTNPLRDEILFDVEWSKTTYTEEDRKELLYKYNNSKNRFLFYPWGIFVTAYARRNLFTGIYAIGEDYIYSDTDSIKLLNHENHKAYFENYNKMVEIKLKRACEYHKIPYELVRPKTIQGKEKILGIWDFEGVYTKFKTLGAKRYMVRMQDVLTIDGKSYDYSITCSGVNKFKAIPYLLNKYTENGIFEAFSNFLSLPTEATGKNLHTYIDYEIEGELVDYLGKCCKFKEKSSTHLEPTGYTLNLYSLFIDYLIGIRFHED